MVITQSNRPVKKTCIWWWLMPSSAIAVVWQGLRRDRKWIDQGALAGVKINLFHVTEPEVSTLDSRNIRAYQWLIFSCCTKQLILVRGWWYQSLISQVHQHIFLSIALKKKLDGNENFCNFTKKYACLSWLGLSLCTWCEMETPFWIGSDAANI